MRQITGLLVGLLLSVSAIAATGTLSFTRPTTYADGSALPASAIASYTVSCSYTPTGGSAAACVGLTPATLPGSAIGGALTFTVTTNGQACFTLQTVDTGGRTSVPSNAACKAIILPNPGPPTDVTVAFTISPDAFEWQVRANSPRFTRVGSVGLGIECGAEVAAPFYELPTASLKPINAYRGGPIFGICLVPPLAG